MPNDFVSREAALIEMDRLKQSADDENEFEETRAYETAKDALLSIPAADVVPVEHGRWIPVCLATDGHYRNVECEICHHREEGYFMNQSFCPNCGAKMTPVIYMGRGGHHAD